jgi:hypothetical protein
MEKEEIINLIKGRIEVECRKHAKLDWSRIAAGKIYTEWFEYFDNENQELKKVMADKKYTEEDIRKAITFGQGIELWKEENQIEDYINSLNKQD